MHVTRITEENRDYFTELVPEEYLADTGVLHLGVISDEGMACGGMSVVMQEGMANVTWLYTAPEERRKGVANGLLEVLTSLLSDHQVEGIQISFTDACEGMEDFLEDRGFLIGEDSRVYSVPVNDLIYSFAMDRLAERDEITGRVFFLSQPINETAVESYLLSKGIEPSHLKEISPDCSFIRMNDKGEVRGCMLIRRDPEEDAEVTWLFNDDYMAGLEELFLTFRDMAEARGLAGENICFSDRNGQIMDYIEQVTEEDRDTYRRFGVNYGVKILS